MCLNRPLTRYVIYIYQASFAHEKVVCGYESYAVTVCVCVCVASLEFMRLHYIFYSYTFVTFMAARSTRHYCFVSYYTKNRLMWKYEIKKTKQISDTRCLQSSFSSRIACSPVACFPAFHFFICYLPCIWCQPAVICVLGATMDFQPQLISFQLIQAKKKNALLNNFLHFTGSLLLVFLISEKISLHTLLCLLIRLSADI